MNIDNNGNALTMTGFVYNSLGTLTEEEKSTLMRLVNKLYHNDGIELKVSIEKIIYKFSPNTEGNGTTNQPLPTL